MTGRGGHITIGGERVAVTEWSMTRVRPTPTDLDLLLAAVLAEPDEDTPRLAFADALDERGGPGDAERAEFIRVQVAMARMSFRERVAAELPVRQVDLIVLHGREWVPDGWLATANPECLEGVTRGAVALFRRGFVDAVACDAESWLRDADMILKDHPTLTRVTLTTMPDWSIVESPPHVFRSNGGAEYLRIQAVISWGDRPPRVFRHDAEIPGAPLSNVRARAAAAIRDAIRPGDWMGAADGWWPRVEFALPPHEVAYVGEDVTLVPHTLTTAVHVPPELLADAGGFGRSVIGQRINDAVNAFPPGTLTMGEPRRADDGSVLLPFAYTPAPTGTIRATSPGIEVAPDPCERCGREPVSRHFDGTRGPRGGWWLCADCHATATMEE